MKTLQHILIIIILINFYSVQAQPELKNDSTLAIPKTNLKLNECIITLGINKPVGAYGRAYQLDGTQTVEESINSTLLGKIGGFGAKYGYQFEIGSMFYYSNKHSRHNWGVKLVYFSFQSNKFEWQNQGDYVFNYANYKNVNQYSFKIGPSYRLAIGKEKNWLRFYYALCPVHASNGSWSYDTKYSKYQDSYRFEIHDEANFSLGKGNWFKHEIGIAVNHKYFIAGLAYSFGKINYNQVTLDRHKEFTVYNYYGNIVQNTTTMSFFTDTFNSKAKTSSINLNVGVKF